VIAASILLIFIAFRYSANTAFPGWRAAIPTGAAAVFLLVGSSLPDRLTRAIGNPVAVWLGDISYSLYLWHWPTLVLAEQMRGRVLSPVQTIACVIFSVAAAALSWRFVEQPFRNKTWTVTRRALMVQA